MPQPLATVTANTLSRAGINPTPTGAPAPAAGTGAPAGAINKGAAANPPAGAPAPAAPAAPTLGKFASALAALDPKMVIQDEVAAEKVWNMMQKEAADKQAAIDKRAAEEYVGQIRQAGQVFFQGVQMEKLAFELLAGKASQDEVTYMEKIANAPGAIGKRAMEIKSLLGGEGPSSGASIAAPSITQNTATGEGTVTPTAANAPAVNHAPARNTATDGHRAFTDTGRFQLPGSPGVSNASGAAVPTR